MAVLEDSSYVLCDVQPKGFSVRFVSPKLCALLGVSAEECAGTSVSALGGECKQGLGPLAEAAGVSIEALSGGLRGVARRAEAEFAALAADVKGTGDATKDSVFTVLVGQRPDGSALVCELDFRVVTHPQTKWKYGVGFYTDITQDSNLKNLLSAAGQTDDQAGDDFDDAVGQRWSCSGHGRRDLLSSPDVQEALHKGAAKMWHDIMASDLLKRGDKKQRSAGQRSLASVSTASGGASSVLSFASARTDRASPESQKKQGRSQGFKREGHEPAREEVRVPFRRRTLRQAVLRAQPQENLFHDILITTNNLCPEEECQKIAKGIFKHQFADSSIPMALLSSTIKGNPVVAASGAFAELCCGDQECIGRVCEDPSQPLKQLFGNSARSQWEYLDLTNPKVFDDPFLRLAEGEWVEAATVEVDGRGPVPMWHYYKQVVLDGTPLVLLVVTEKSDEEPRSSVRRSQSAPPAPKEVLQLSSDVDGALEVLAQLFWLMASMRRQTTQRQASLLSLAPM